MVSLVSLAHLCSSVSVPARSERTGVCSTNSLSFFYGYVLSIGQIPLSSLNDWLKPLLALLILDSVCPYLNCRVILSLVGTMPE
jgi:hypothetical protein